MHLCKPLAVSISFFIVAAAAPSANFASSGNIPQLHILERGNTPPGRLSQRLTTYKESSGSPPPNQLSPLSNPSALPVGSTPPPVDPYSLVSDSWTALRNPLPPAQPISTKPHKVDRSSRGNTPPLAERSILSSCFEPGGCPSGKGSRSSLTIHPQSPFLQCGPQKQSECDRLCRCDDAGHTICSVQPRDNAEKSDKADKQYEYLNLMGRVCRHSCRCATAPSPGKQSGPPSLQQGPSGTPHIAERGAVQSCAKDLEQCHPNTRSRASSALANPPANKAPLSPFPTEIVPTVKSRGRHIECSGPNKDYCKSHCYCFGSGNMNCDKQSKAEYERSLQTPAHFMLSKAEDVEGKQVAKVTEECGNSCQCLEKPV